MRELKPINRRIDKTNAQAVVNGVRKAVLQDKTNEEIWGHSASFYIGNLTGQRHTPPPSEKNWRDRALPKKGRVNETK